METPIESKKPGIFWKLRTTFDGLYVASRSWYYAVKKELKGFEMKSVSDDNAFFTMNKEGE